MNQPNLFYNMDPPKQFFTITIYSEKFQYCTISKLNIKVAKFATENSLQDNINEIIITCDNYGMCYLYYDERQPNPNYEKELEVYNEWLNKEAARKRQEKLDKQNKSATLAARKQYKEQHRIERIQSTLAKR